MVTGTTLNGTDTRAGWASYFLDHSDVLPGRPSTTLGGPPAHCSYVRRALLRVGGFPEDLRAGEDTVVNERLAELGFTARRAQDVHLVHHTRCTTAWRLLLHHARRGRSYGRILLAQHRDDGGLLHRRGPVRQFDIQVRRRVRTIDANVRQWGDADLPARHREVRRLIAAAATAHWLGTCAEILRPAPGKVFVLTGRPVVTVGLGRGEAGDPGTEGLVRADVVSRRVQVVRGTGDPGDPDDAAGARAAARDGAISQWPSGRGPLTWWRLLRGRAGDTVGRPARLTLAWARARTPVARVHEIHVGRFTAGSPGALEPASLERLLDTHDRHERARPAGTSGMTR
jgi:hypothetical protein